ncbi:Vps5 C terminal like-domain-containing protein [Gymnopilus junonius]|uniref:Vps5 C terminal like-domain-containing protein n=1 Tax=Gymnopilus junonius TaxID=109634 RepID=A0A9P5NRB9_GYMJU|nr:Vps5 C terminal like-domain-containing protein [Gymnopilus junonius]
MDNFDDLLAPSRQALENNPFADHRSGSPDPWATPFATHDAENAFGSTSEHFISPDPSYASSSTDFGSFSAEVGTAKKPDPLYSDTHNEEDDDNEPLGNLRSPGFRESVATSTFSETATIRPDHIEEFDTHISASSSATSEPSSSSSAVEKPDTTVSTPTTAHTPTKTPSRPSSGFNSVPPSAMEATYRSPLEAPFGGIERSLGGLSLGGESLGGWQSEEQTPWQSEQFTHTPLPPKAAPIDDDSDDDKPILQAYSKQLDREGPPPIPRNDNGIQPVFVISVDDPQKVGDPIRSFTMYTVHTRTTSPLYQKSAFSVLRRYSDFLWLYETLSNNNPGVVVPPVPEKNTFGRFDDQFVRQRRLALEKCIQKTANHPVLGKDPDLKLFLESDTFSLDIKHRKAEIAQERGGLIASIGQSITGPRFYETDEWFDRQKVYLDSLESQLRGLVKAIEFVAKHRTELAVTTGEFAQNVSELSSSDVGKQLVQSLAGLAEVEKTAQDLQNVQSEQDMATLMATVDEYARLINSVRLAFASRIRVYHTWKHQENELLKTKQNHEKSRAQGRIPTDRLGYSLTQIAEAERRASDAKLEYEQVSKLVKAEVARFEQERIEDFKDSLHAFLEGMISRQKELIAAWEKYQQMLLKKVGGGGPTPVSVQPVASSNAIDVDE